MGLWQDRPRTGEGSTTTGAGYPANSAWVYGALGGRRFSHQTAKQAAEHAFAGCFRPSDALGVDSSRNVHKLRRPPANDTRRTVV